MRLCDTWPELRQYMQVILQISSKDAVRISMNIFTQSKFGNNFTKISLWFLTLLDYIFNFLLQSHNIKTGYVYYYCIIIIISDERDYEKNYKTTAPR